ncbi:phosphate transport system permease protein [Bacteroidota bacterium]|nr:phosphate transport system permease protein [Bacteroidota bacterium]
MKKILSYLFNRFITILLYISGSITSIIVILIVIFLFSEGSGLFGKKPTEEGSIMAVNKTNKVKHLNAEQIKLIFDGEITNWKTVGGKNDSIILFRMDNITDYYTEEQIGENFENLPKCISQVVDSMPGIIALVNKKYIAKDFAGKELKIDKITVTDFLFGKLWFPTAQPVAVMGALPLLLGTFWVSIFAILFALPLGLATAIYMAEVAHPTVRNILKPVIELLAGIPSVVYGFFGLIVVVPLIQSVFNLPVGETAFAGSIVLGIMALPTIITISEDAIRTTPRSMKEASLALGATQWQTIFRVIIPYSSSGITAGAILGIGRAIGETMAVLMVTGNAAVIPHSLLQPVRTIPATIAAELGETSQGGLHYQALFTLGCILFLITLIVNLAVEFISRKRKRVEA